MGHYGQILIYSCAQQLRYLLGHFPPRSLSIAVGRPSITRIEYRPLWLARLFSFKDKTDIVMQTLAYYYLLLIVIFPLYV